MTGPDSLLSLPLANRAVLRTHDLEEAREGVARIFCPHRLELTGRRRRLDARHHVARLGAVAVNFVQYGADVEIEPGCLGTFFLLQMPVRGRARIECGRHAVYSDTETASLLSPTLPTRMEWNEACAQLMLYIDRQALERHLGVWLGRPPKRPVEFDPAVSLRLGAGRSLWHLTGLLLAECERSDGLDTTAPSALVHLEQAVLDAMLRGLDHNYREALDRPSSPAAPRHVRLAESYMEAHASEPVTMEDLVAITGVSARTLQEGFHRFRDTTPMQYLRDVRLAGVRQALLEGRGPVTDVAMAWGFGHLGRFSCAYRRRFGERPTDTLRRATGR